jgi:peptidoglycan/LPS O-acetylase OafA/YrhL
VADQFAAGMLIALLVQSPRVREVVGQRWVKLAGLAAGIAITVGSIALYAQEQLPDYYRSYFHVVWWPLTFALGASLLVLFVQQFEHSIGVVARRSGLAFLGLISYSVYLFHSPIISMCRKAWVRVEPPIGGWAMLALLVACILAFCSVTYLVVERPFMAWSHRSKGARRGGFAAPAPAPAPAMPDGPPDDDRPSEPLAVTD